MTTKRVQDLNGTEVIRNRGPITSITKRGADIFRIDFADGTFRTCAWGAVFTLEG